MAIGRLEQLSCLGKMAPADKKGKITAEAIAEAMTPRTALVSLSWANGLTGVSILSTKLPTCATNAE